MVNYLKLMDNILDYGVPRVGRNGNTTCLFARQLRFNLEDGFPAVTTKRLAFKSMKAELLGFVRAYTHASQFEKLGTKIWNANAEAWGRDGDLGRIYGVQWRKWRTPTGIHDQLAHVIEQIKFNPHSGEHIVTAWNPSDLEEMALPPCHIGFQLFVANGRLSLQMYQRSADMFLGVPFNIASYALLLSMIAQVTELRPHELIITLGDAHIYESHIPQVREQLDRKPLPAPTLELNSEVTCIDDFKMQDIKLKNYKHHGSLPAVMAV